MWPAKCLEIERGRRVRECPAHDVRRRYRQYMGALKRLLGRCKPADGSVHWFHKNEPVSSGRYVRCARCKKRAKDFDALEHSVHFND